jgi:hypothetical protein
VEVQSHGVVFEDSVVRSITGLSKAEYQTRLTHAYFATMDVVKGVESDTNYSIKVSKGRDIGCANILRFIDHCRDSEFTMVVGVWQQISPTVKRYTCIYEFDITPAHYNLLWANVDKETVEQFVEYVKSVPHGPEGQQAHKKLWKQRRREIYETYGQGLCQIDAKIDSKRQRRVQGRFRIKDLIAAQAITHRKYETEYRGIQLPYEQDSGPRQFD